MNRRIWKDESLDWKDESLMKFPKIDLTLKAESGRNVKARGSILNEIKRKQQVDFTERIAAIDRKINMNYLLKSNSSYMSLTRNRLPISTFFEKSMVNKIMKNVSKNSKIPNYDYSTGKYNYTQTFLFYRLPEYHAAFRILKKKILKNLFFLNTDNFARKSLESFKSDSSNGCKRYRYNLNKFEDNNYKSIFSSLNSSLTTSTAAVKMDTFLILPEIKINDVINLTNETKGSIITNSTNNNSEGDGEIDKKKIEKKKVDFIDDFEMGLSYNLIFFYYY